MSIKIDDIKMESMNTMQGTITDEILLFGASLTDFHRASADRWLQKSSSSLKLQNVNVTHRKECKYRKTHFQLESIEEESTLTTVRLGME
jgi:hypothetical protein